LTSALDSDGQLHTPAALAHRKSLWYPLYKRLGGPQSQSWTRRGRQKIPAPAGIRTPLPPDHPARSPALYYWAIPDPIFRQAYRKSVTS